jgi:hypothetical protein
MGGIGGGGDGLGSGKDGDYVVVDEGLAIGGGGGESKVAGRGGSVTEGGGGGGGGEGGTRKIVRTRDRQGNIETRELVSTYIVLYRVCSVCVW